MTEYDIWTQVLALNLIRLFPLQNPNPEPTDLNFTYALRVKGQHYIDCKIIARLFCTQMNNALNLGPSLAKEEEILRKPAVWANKIEDD